MTHATDTHRPRRALAAHHLGAGPASIFGLLWIVVPVVEFAGTDPSAWQVALVAAGLVAFAPCFLAPR